MNMNELVQTTFKTISSCIETLAQLSIQHLQYQKNDSVQSAEDCRRDFIARRPFYKLARDKNLSLPCYENGPFKLV
ncbi:hypothetical protein N7533_012474 [Penicillium manginii]|uniref:uncharacterized protein n=1 Tax=Penicillium manginii TaxID=203109 RepID=UPI0025498293|nr:uncharacterized protein N7533_012474 [Penicillium manginii]KAJ5739690.1 hypothetical protein N7533_012474 [Penicillium manginii]